MFDIGAACIVVDVPEATGPCLYSAIFLESVKSPLKRPIEKLVYEEYIFKLILLELGLLESLTKTFKFTTYISFVFLRGMLSVIISNSGKFDIASSK